MGPLLAHWLTGVCVCGKTSSVRRVVWPNNFSAGERQSERQTSQRTCEVHDRLAGSSGNFIATSSCSVQRATYSVQRATVAAKYFYLYFIAPVEQLQFICPVLAQASPAGQTQSASVLQQPVLLLPLPLLLPLCSAALYGAPPDAVYVFSFILSPQLGLGLPALAINSSSTQLKGRLGGGGERCRRYCINYDLVDFYDKP